MIAIKEELESLHKNETWILMELPTWILMELPKEKIAIVCKWFSA